MHKASGGSQRPHIETAAGLDTSFRLAKKNSTTNSLTGQRSKLDSLLAGETVFAGFRAAQLIRFASFRLQYTGDQFLVSNIKFAINPKLTEDQENSLAVLRKISEGEEFHLLFRLKYKDEPVSHVYTTGQFSDKGLANTKASLIFESKSSPIQLGLFRPFTKSEISSNDMMLWVYIYMVDNDKHKLGGSGGGDALKNVVRD